MNGEHPKSDVPTSKERLYAERDHYALSPHFERHMLALTGEGLERKVAIAAEFAHRDAEIERLRNIVGNALALCTGEYVAECRDVLALADSSAHETSALPHASAALKDFMAHLGEIMSMEDGATPADYLQRARDIREWCHDHQTLPKLEYSDHCDCCVRNKITVDAFSRPAVEPSPVKVIPDPDPNERCGYCSVKRSLHNAGGVGSCGNWRPQEKASEKRPVRKFTGQDFPGASCVDCKQPRRAHGPNYECPPLNGTGDQT